MTGTFSLTFAKGGQRGRRCLLRCSIIGNFVLYQNRLETNLLQLFAHPKNSEWYSIIYVIIFEVNIVAEQKRAYFATIFCFSKGSIGTDLFKVCWQ